MLSFSILALSALLPALSAAQQLRSDPGVAGPPLELVHFYNNQWPTGILPYNAHSILQLSILGITVSKTGRKFANYPSGLDPNNTNTGSNQKYAVQEILPNGTEIPYPSADMNNPPGGAINYTTTPQAAQTMQSTSSASKASSSIPKTVSGSSTQAVR
ncbi:hypothetical protein PTNB73_07979 [Pyrenophora teres f. teres]|nr:hypothetical protein PTNB73_07979 [Pyrenophora teres f. teres]